MKDGSSIAFPVYNQEQVLVSYTADARMIDDGPIEIEIDNEMYTVNYGSIGKNIYVE